ncbi:glycerate kinase type-2 family protein [Kaarinaea lacus]
MNFNNSHREDLTLIYRAALSAVNGKHCVAQYLRDNPVKGEIYLLAIGKAASAMAKAALEILASQIKKGLIITKPNAGVIDGENIEFIEAGHPVPDDRSITAGHQLIEFVTGMPSNAKLICLISGGTSSLVEVLPDSVTLEQLIALNEWLLQSGLPIGEMNAIRKRVSRIKGGRLAKMLRGYDVTVLLISDVRGDSPSDIGSGLLFPPTAKDLLINPEDYPEKISRLMQSAPPLPDPEDPCFDQIDFSIVATLKMAINAAQQMAISKGYEVVVHQDYLQGDAIEAGKFIADEIRKVTGAIHIWGGECTVKLPKKHGVGGRCQSLALSAAIALGDEASWCLLAAGTDGSDGTGDVAGVCVDNESFKYARQLFHGNGAAEEYLRRADAGSYFQQTNDLLITGATGTNVTDIVLGYAN